MAVSSSTSTLKENEDPTLTSSSSFSTSSLVPEKSSKAQSISKIANSNNAESSCSKDDEDSESTTDSSVCAGISAPHGHDVLCGRGVTTNRHKGNEKFRELVDEKKNEYVESTKRQKMNISRSIVLKVRSFDPPGRFLERNLEDGLWYDIGDKKAAEKTAQALRDRAANFRKQMSEEQSDKSLPHSNSSTHNSSTNATNISTTASTSIKDDRRESWRFRSEHQHHPPPHHRNAMTMSPSSSYHTMIHPNDIIKPKTSFDPSVKGWGSCIDGRSDTFFNSSTYVMRKNRHRRSSSTPNVSYNKKKGHKRQDFMQREYYPCYETPPPPPQLFSPSTDEFAFHENFSEILQEPALSDPKTKKRRAHHRRANTLPAAPHAFGGSHTSSSNNKSYDRDGDHYYYPHDDMNEFEPIPFSKKYDTHQCVEDDEKRLSKDIFSPEFVTVIFGSKRRVPDLGYAPSNRAYPTPMSENPFEEEEDHRDNIVDHYNDNDDHDTMGDDDRWNNHHPHDSKRNNNHQYHTNSSFHSIHEKAYEYSKRRQLREQQHLKQNQRDPSGAPSSKHHRKRRSGDFSDLSFISDAFGGSFENASEQRNARCHRKTQSTPGAFTQHHQDRHPPSKKYRQISSPQSPRRPEPLSQTASFSFHSPHAHPHSPGTSHSPQSPRTAPPTQEDLILDREHQDFMTRDQFSYIAQGANYRNNSFVSSTPSHPPPSSMSNIQHHSYTPIENHQQQQQQDPLLSSSSSSSMGSSSGNHHGQYRRHLHPDEASPTTVFDESSPSKFYEEKTFDDCSDIITSLPAPPYTQRMTSPSSRQHPENVFEARYQSQRS